MKNKRLIIILALLDIPIIIGVLMWFFVLRAPVASFNDLPGATLSEQEKYELAMPIGHSERLMWEAYYKQDSLTLGKELVSILQNQFSLNALDAVSVGEPLAKAAMAFAKSSSAYDEHVLPHLVTAYTKIQQLSGMNFEPQKVAAAELGWWVARRTPGQDSPENVGVQISKLYTAIYGVDNGDILRAGRLRATAANERDTNPNDPPWAEIEAALTEGYIALITGIMQGNT